MNDALGLSHEVLEGELSLSEDVVESVEGELVTDQDSQLIDPMIQMQQDLLDDYKDTRESLKGLVDKAETALATLLNVAEEGEQARAFEVASNLINTIKDVNKTILELQKQIRDIYKEQAASRGRQTATDRAQGGGNVTNNAFFVGSTQEALELLKKSREERNDVDGS